MTDNLILIDHLLKHETETTTETEIADCFFSEPATFLSVEELECGQSPDGIALCHWRITFDNGMFDWFYSDVVEMGSYTCEGSNITSSGNGAIYTGSFSNDILIWDGIEYKAE